MNKANVSIRWRCNVCGHEIRDEPIALSINKTIGYGSRFDMEKLHLRMCAQCMDKIIIACKIRPIE